MAKKICHLHDEPEKNRAILRVDRDTLDMSEQQEFRDNCRELMSSSHDRLYVDLRSLRSLLSIYLDIVLEANNEARAAGKKFTVLVRERLGDLFRTVIGPELMDISSEDPE